MLYLSLKNTGSNSYVFVLGNDNRPFNVHASIGKFPIRFGSGFSEYPFERPLQTNMGVAANVPAFSFNFENYWNAGHKTKASVFGFIRYFTEGKEHDGNKTGFNVQHEWKPQKQIAKNIDSITGGFSWVEGLPIVEDLKSNIDGMDVYFHINSGPLKIKIEGLMGGAKRWWNDKSRKMLPDDRSSSGRSVRSGRSKSKRRAVSRSRPRRWNQFFKLPSSTHCVIHGELAYKLPLKRNPIAIFGYTWGNSNSLVAHQRIFLGYKVGLFENMHFLIGYRGEEGLRTQSRKDSERYRHWRHNVAVQCSFVV